MIRTVRLIFQTLGSGISATMVGGVYSAIALIVCMGCGNAAATGDGDGGTAGDAGRLLPDGRRGDFRSVWPGTTTRFYPGIYFYAGTDPTPAHISRVFEQAYSAHNDGDDWRVKDSRGNDVTHVGVNVQLAIRSFYRDETLAPSAYDVSCMRSADAADPGWSNYDWDYLESLLSESFVAAGGKILVSLEDVHGRPLPRWMADQGMVDTGANPIDTGGNGRAALWRRKTTAALQDSYEAFARRFAGDERIAAVVIGESEVGSRADLDLEDGATVCGNIDELTGYRAQRRGRIYQAAALKEGDPDLMVMVMKLHRGMESGYASNAPGMNDRPGQWGTMGDGGEFFVRMCGSGVFPEVDCVDPESTTAVAHTLRQEYAMANSHPTGTDARSYQWTNSDPGCCRLGDLNPWGYSAWPVVRGFWPGQDGEWKDQPSPQHWVWYNSDEPKNTDSDSALGQLGPDPGGVSPVQFYIPRPAEEIQQSPADSTNADTRTYSDFAEAIDTFGPSGTGAMFRLPPGYLQ